MRFRSVQTALIVSLAMAGSGASAQSLQWAMPGSGPVHIVAGQTDVQVQVVDLATGATVSQIMLEEPGDGLLLPDPPQNLAVHTVGIASVDLGSAEPSSAYGSVLHTAGAPLGTSFLTLGSGQWTAISNRSAALPEATLTIQSEPPVTLATEDSVARGNRIAFFELGELEDVVQIDATTPSLLQRSASDGPDQGWSLSVASLRNEEGVVSRGGVRVAIALAIYAPTPTVVALVDHSDSDDSGTWSIPRGGLIIAPANGVEGIRARAPVEVIDAFDDDLVELVSTSPVLATTGAFGVTLRGSATASAPTATREHTALLAGVNGTLTLISDAATPATVTTIAAVAPLDAPVQIAPAEWLGAGPVFVNLPTQIDTLTLVQAEDPFVAFVRPDNGCCGPWSVPTLRPHGDQPPIARVGPDIVSCPFERVDLANTGSFDPDGGEIVAFAWDLNLAEDSDGFGGTEDDFDALGPRSHVRPRIAGTLRVSMTVEDDDGARDTRIVEIQTLPATDPACGGDVDLDGVGGGIDNCPETPNPEQTNIDEDEFGDACDNDNDNDAVPDVQDNCPRHPNTDQIDIDSDGFGDACDPDIDGDARPNESDNCPLIANFDQTDTDSDATGDLCDADDDGDSVLDREDNCILVHNPDQRDENENGIGDACETDEDGDGQDDSQDNCVGVSNPDQSDLDHDGQGDACDEDIDADGELNASDNCPRIPNPAQEDADGNGVGDVCEPDSDGDTVPDHLDTCPEVFNPEQEDQDGDGIGDACDEDLDGDGLDAQREDQLGTDPTSPDTDTDELSDGDEVLVHSTDPLEEDTDLDGLTDGTEVKAGSSPLSADTDGDGLLDGLELGWNEDSDRDGAINAADPDSDNGGVEDGVEVERGSHMLDPSDDTIPEPGPAKPHDGCGTAVFDNLYKKQIARLLLIRLRLP